MKYNLKYSSREINYNFRIKIAGEVEGEKVNVLVGVSGLVRMIGEKMADKLLDRAFRSLEDVCVCKLRRGVKISFYAK